MSSAEILDEDQQLMLRLKSGDDLALNTLMERWQNPLVSFILRYTGHMEDAEDLAQETFVRVYEYRHHYEPAAKYSTWLFTIAANLCRNHARWRERHPTVTLYSSERGNSFALEYSIPSPEADPADTAERNDLASAVREHIQRLPHDLKTAIILFEYQDLGYEEIAAALKCSPKAVETRLYRARKLLREALEHFRVNRSQPPLRPGGPT